MQRQRDLCKWLGIEIPIVQAPMAGAQDHALAIGVTRAGGLGSLPCAMLSVAQIREQAGAYRAAVPGAPLHLNFFCHSEPAIDPSREQAWRALLAPYYAEFEVPESQEPTPTRAPFAEAQCALVEELKPEVVSFHFGLPPASLLARVQAAGAKVFASATSVREARFLEAHGADVIIAQGSEAGGHRGMFLTDAVANQVGSLALVPQVVDAVRVPVLCAGGVGDARGIAAALALGAAGVQIGSAYLRAPESKISPLHRAALARCQDDSTVITNVFTGRPARGIENRATRELGPLAPAAPAFPQPVAPLAPLRARAEIQGSSDFSPLWAGQAVALGTEASAYDLTRALWEGALDRLAALAR